MCVCVFVRVCVCVWARLRPVYRIGGFSHKLKLKVKEKKKEERKTETAMETKVGVCVRRFCMNKCLRVWG